MTRADRHARSRHRRACRVRLLRVRRGRPLALLRHRVVLTVAALAATGLIVTDLTDAVLVRSYLVGRLDTQLEAEARALTGTPAAPVPAPGTTDQPARFLPARYRSASGLDCRMFVYATDGTRLHPVPDAGDGGPDLARIPAIATRAAATPFTVVGASGDWRVLVTPIADGRQYLVHAVSMRTVETAERSLILVHAVIASAVVLLIALAAATVVRAGLRPVQAALADRGASERRLRQFLADASHELRTPLTSIQGFAELYRRGGAPPGPALDEAMVRIEAEVGRARLLINDLLLLARLDEERPLERSPVDLLAVAADAVRDAHVRVPTRFVQLAALDDTSDTFEAVTVLGDESRIRQVVTNLVANALQHTPDDCPVVVRVGTPGRWETGPDARTQPLPAATVGATLPDGVPVAVVEVADEGPGMSVAEARHAFERLYRADPARTCRQGGAGLGLAIVAAIVQAHGGRVELYTAAGAGARFRVLLPATAR
ncbi:sensor histidine kinase [Planosporangium thailandense]|uniref:sensor histidine kinase n=1 Tax=Planosporangium thailandense TaxID=765197 RepID=UPI001F108AAD|nr:HAMP domain-containing sensor histidine kinase [Planosporangium thailandense]